METRGEHIPGILDHIDVNSSEIGPEQQGELRKLFDRTDQLLQLYDANQYSTPGSNRKLAQATVDIPNEGATRVTISRGPGIVPDRMIVTLDYPRGTRLEQTVEFYFDGGNFIRFKAYAGRGDRRYEKEEVFNPRGYDHNSIDNQIKKTLKIMDQEQFFQQAHESSKEYYNSGK